MLTTIWVSIGSWPLSVLKMPTNTGIRKSSIPTRTSVAKREDDDRVDHRALDAPLDLRVLLDLNRDPVENDVESSRRFARFDHRDVQPVEDLRMPAHRAGEDDAALDVLTDVGDHDGEVLVFRLLLEDHERGDDADAGLDQRRELAREDLERLRGDLLDPAGPGAGGCLLLQDRAGEQALLAQLVAGGVEVGRMEEPPRLGSARIDR